MSRISGSPDVKEGLYENSFMLKRLNKGHEGTAREFNYIHFDNKELDRLIDVLVEYKIKAGL